MAIDTKTPAQAPAPNPVAPNHRRQPDPRIPHPSWRHTITGADQGAGRVISAFDFWVRLGI